MNTESVNPLEPSGAEIVMELGVAAILAFMVYSLVSVLRSRKLSGIETALWVLIVIIAPLLGSCAWLYHSKRRLPTASD